MGNQIVLPVGRVQDRVDSGVVGPRCDAECPVGIVTIHRETCAIEIANRRWKDDEVQSSCRLRAVSVSSRVGRVVKGIVHGVEIAAYVDGRACRIGKAVVAGRRRALAHDGLHAATVTVGVVSLDILNHIGLAQFSRRI